MNTNPDFAIKPTVASIGGAFKDLTKEVGGFIILSRVYNTFEKQQQVDSGLADVVLPHVMEVVAHSKDFYKHHLAVQLTRAIMDKCPQRAEYAGDIIELAGDRAGKKGLPTVVDKAKLEAQVPAP